MLLDFCNNFTVYLAHAKKALNFAVFGIFFIAASLLFIFV